MTSFQSAMNRAAFWLAGGSTVAILFSIAASQILLGLALAALLLSGSRLCLPPIRLPLALFMLGTIVSLLLSGDPASGLPQIRKFFVFVTLLVVYSTFREVADVRRLILCWAGAGAVVSAQGLAQFVEKYREAQLAGRDFYEYYVGERITGFMSHWMTFGGQLTFVFVLIVAFVFFSPAARGKLRWFGLLSASLLGTAILLSWNRSMWPATGAAFVYLVWYRRKLLLFALPLVLAAAIWLVPGVRGRVVSIVRPHGDMDSNQFRIVCWRTGWQMIKAHPWFGLGPEQVRIQFYQWVPQDIPRPLPTGWYGHLHNIFIHYAAERGIPTMLFLVWLLVKILFDFLRAVRRLPPGPSDARFLLHGGVAVIIVTVLTGLFELNLGDSEVLSMFLAAVACCYVACDTASAGSSSRAQTPPAT
jgi:O-antigen ligase